MENRLICLPTNNNTENTSHTNVALDTDNVILQTALVPIKLYRSAVRLLYFF